MEMWQTGLRLDPGKNHRAGRPGKVVMTCAQLGTVHPASKKSFHLASCPRTHYIHTISAVPPPDQRVSSYSGLQVWLGPALLPSQEERKRRLLPRQDGGEKPDSLLTPARSRVSPSRLHLLSRKKASRGSRARRGGPPSRERGKRGFCQGRIGQAPVVPKLPCLASGALHR